MTPNTREGIEDWKEEFWYKIAEWNTAQPEDIDIYANQLEMLIEYHIRERVHQELQKAREETIAKHFTSIGMVHLNAFCKLLKSQHSKGKDVMYTVRRTEQYPFIFETKADVAKEVGKYIQSELDQPNK